MVTESPAGPFRIGGVDVAPGEHASIALPVTNLYTRGEVTMPVRVVRGKKAGPVLFVSAAIHGDEINGVEIIHRLLASKSMAKLRGALIAVPVVNVFGFLSHSRYLPDRRDLNRSFPGSERGSLAARMARLFMDEVVAKSTHGIDLHTAAVHRRNLPQVRATLDQPGVLEMAESFEVPVIVNAELRDGSLRAAVHERGIPLIVYEGGEALRFGPMAIRVGYRGILGVMRKIGMLPKSEKAKKMQKPSMARSTSWVRAPESGVLRVRIGLGSHVSEREELGRIGDPFGGGEITVVSPVSGILIGMTQIPLVNEGDALFHIAQIDGTLPGSELLEAFQREYEDPWSFEPTEGGT
jgi:predicted deacylase